ncbi:DUF1906 domain-containing protein [Streptomyces sp. NPDC020681]|uniref:DUF1906 domain-containing protein n=1 Tax=Streptomyces sp. NPDC020681 TaxID=3365083 RepID=UPI003797D130
MRLRTWAPAAALTLVALLALLLAAAPDSDVPAGVEAAALGDAPLDAPAGAAVDTTADTAVTFRGQAFDTCRTPKLATMRAWRKSSPYGAVGVYYAGRGRGCLEQPHLNRSWVAEVHRMGWQVLPVFVGSQAPCVRDEHRRKVAIGSKPAAQGQREGSEAVRQAWALGMIRGSALYLDLEAYDVDNETCARTALDFARAWNREVRRQGYVPGFYSSADSGVLHMERARLAGTGDLPSAMWFARWRGKPSLYGERVLNPYAWRPSRRIHQYEGEVTEQHGGHSLTIDRNMADAPVARIRP